MIRFLIDDFGSELAIGLESQKRSEIELWFNWFYNFKFTSGELIWVFQDDKIKFAYCWCSSDGFENGLYNAAEMYVFRKLNCNLSDKKSDLDKYRIEELIVERKEQYRDLFQYERFFYFSLPIINSLKYSKNY
mgnify:FL=1